jgi:hypothetical protein
MKRLIMSVIVLGLASPITSVVAQEREIGRYQIVMNPVLAQSTFLLDTVSGSFIKSHRLGNLSIALISMAIHISDGLLIGVYDFEAALDRLNAPWGREAPHAALEPFSGS